MAGSSSVTNETRVLKSARELAISAMLPVGAAPPSTAPLSMVSSESFFLSLLAATSVHTRVKINENFILMKGCLLL